MGADSKKFPGGAKAVSMHHLKVDSRKASERHKALQNMSWKHLTPEMKDELLYAMAVQLGFIKSDS
jgi:hypothetical protein